MDIVGTIGEGIDPQIGVIIDHVVVDVVDNYGNYCGYSQYVCQPVASVIHVPIVATFHAATSFLINALTARNVLDALQLLPV